MLSPLPKKISIQLPLSEQKQFLFYPNTPFGTKTIPILSKYPFRNSISAEDRVLGHDSTGSAKHRIVQTKRLSEAGLEVDQDDRTEESVGRDEVFEGEALR